MTAREYLEQAITLDREIDSKIMMLERMRAMATKTTSVLSGMPGHESGTKGLEETIAKIVDMEREINGDIDRLVELKREIMGVISQVPDAMCRIVLEKRYLNNQRNSDIATEMNYGYDWIYALHKKGLKMVEEILDNSEPQKEKSWLISEKSTNE